VPCEQKCFFTDTFPFALAHFAHHGGVLSTDDVLYKFTYDINVDVDTVSRK